jgi:hypothetical protein
MPTCHQSTISPQTDESASFVVTRSIQLTSPTVPNRTKSAGFIDSNEEKVSGTELVDWVNFDEEKVSGTELVDWVNFVPFCFSRTGQLYQLTKGALMGRAPHVDVAGHNFRLFNRSDRWAAIYAKKAGCETLERVLCEAVGRCRIVLVLLNAQSLALGTPTHGRWGMHTLPSCATGWALNSGKAHSAISMRMEWPRRKCLCCVGLPRGREGCRDRKSTSFSDRKIKLPQWSIARGDFGRTVERVTSRYDPLDDNAAPKMSGKA